MSTMVSLLCFQIGRARRRAWPETLVKTFVSPCSIGKARLFGEAANCWSRDGTEKFRPALDKQTRRPLAKCAHNDLPLSSCLIRLPLFRLPVPPDASSNARKQKNSWSLLKLVSRLK